MVSYWSASPFSAMKPLLRRFLQRRGLLVLGLCRRLLSNPQDAEDAFQATFLVLLRKAGSIVRRVSLGSWLYGVAYRIAGKARQQADRRRTHERQGHDMQSRPHRWFPAASSVRGCAPLVTLMIL